MTLKLELSEPATHRRVSGGATLNAGSDSNDSDSSGKPGGLAASSRNDTVRQKDKATSDQS